MASPQAIADSIRTALCSTSTCTPTTATLLNDLLLPKFEPQASTGPKKLAASASAVSRSRAAKTPAAKTRSKKATTEDEIHVYEDRLSPKERSILATEVINATLKSLSEAIKNPPPTAGRRNPVSSKDMVKASARQALRRSNSAPQSPLQSRSLNRVSSSPNISTRDSRSSSSASIAPSGSRPTAECARAAFACLRALQASKGSENDLPQLQLENGMSVLVGKLVLLGLDDLAIKELRILKRRLEVEEGLPKTGISKVSTAVPPQTLAQLLDFGAGPFTGTRLSLIITTQLQILRLMTTSRRAQNAEGALPTISLSHASSPIKLLLLAAKQTKDPKQLEKIIRQFQTLSEVLLSLCPSVSSTEDSLAQSQVLSAAPEIAIQLQTLALHSRFLWWGLADHKGDYSKDLLEPFTRCLSAFSRRSQCGVQETYRISMSSYQNFVTLILDCTNSPPLGSTSVLSGLYKLLVTLAKDTELIDEAIHWAEMLQGLSDPKVDSEAKQCAVIARLVALNLRRPLRKPSDEELLIKLLDGLERPLRGEAADIEDLMVEVSSARKSAITLLANVSAFKSLSVGTRDMCETLIFSCPRLCLRYLGTTPEGKSTTKDIVRYEQRRNFVTKLGLHAIDSSLFLLKTLLAHGNSTWDLVDSKLQDCLTLLDRLQLNTENASTHKGSQSYYVRISNMYYSQFFTMRHDILQSETPKDGQQLRALRRAVDCLRPRMQTEKDSAYYASKLERLAEVLKANGRYDELHAILSQLQSELIRKGVLGSIAKDAGSGSMKTAWNKDKEASSLARTFQSLLKLQIKRHVPPPQASSYESLSNEEKGTMLEYQLHVLCNEFRETDLTKSHINSTLCELLGIYRRDLFPIRRLRVLIHALCLDHASRGQTGNEDDIVEELCSLSSEVIDAKTTNDQDLTVYLKHYQNLAITSLELLKEEPQVDVLKQALGVWSSIRASCSNSSSFFHQVEDVKGLVMHLQTIGSYLNMAGFGEIHLATLRLIADIEELCVGQTDPDDVILSFLSLGTQWLKLGYSGKAGIAHTKANDYLTQNGVTTFTRLEAHLSRAEWLLAVGNLNEAESSLQSAQALYKKEKDDIPRPKSMSSLDYKTRGNLLASKAYLVYSKVALERGQVSDSLAHAKISTRLVRRAWANMDSGLRREGKSQVVREANLSTETDRLVDDISQLSLSANPADTTSEHVQCGSNFWPLVTPLFEALSHLSNIYAHHGMFQETVYYAEQAYTLAKQLGPQVNLANAKTLLGGIWLRAGSFDKGAEFLADAKRLRKPSEKCLETAILTCQLGNLNGLLGDREAELRAYEEARDILQSIMAPTFIDDLDKIASPTASLEEKMFQLTVSKRKPVTRKTAIRSNGPVKRKPTAPKAKPAEVMAPSKAQQCNQIVSVKVALLRDQARVLMEMKRSAEAWTYIQEAEDCSRSRLETIEHALALSEHLLLQSLEQMNADPVYSVLLDSTISFPSITGLLKAEKYGDRLSVSKVSPPSKTQRGKSSRDRARSVSPAPDSFFDKLRQAQEKLSEVYSAAVGYAPVAVMHRLAALLNSIAILLSAAGHVKGRSLAYPGFSSYTIETARTLARHRECMAHQPSSEATLKLSDFCWPTSVPFEPTKAGLSYPCDMSRFQKDYIDIIPQAWTVVSISLSDSRNELSITKFQAGYSPFVLRLPLGRHNSIDADEETFGFEQGQAELREILALANETAHDAANRVGREAKRRWWEEREALDARLKELLENIEKVWLGGFTGIFSQHSRRSELLARFQKSFQNILDKHLPSRQKTGKRKSAPRVTLDSRILDLFIGLGDATDEECDLSEPLTDLLYFVVDVLQFHGELNAYAEIDFDSIVVETHDALRSYHTAARTSSVKTENKHTILILDKTLHCLPWESLPCMDGLAVSRLTSLGCLADRIASQKNTIPAGGPDGLYVPRNNGTYILNPEEDLKHTQTTFEQTLGSFGDWDGIVARAPSENEMKDALNTKDIFLYFGHGSGAQFIRSREFRSLEKCAVTALMGCSSGELVETGEFEPYGPALNYMYAGCPALVATLWDVTDKDIDRFGKSTFEKWGLFEAEPVARSRGKGKKIDASVQGVSLVEAVAKSRKACRLRYLNAAAVCVYGIPVYLK